MCWVCEIQIRRAKRYCRLKLAIDGLNDKNMPENLRLKLSKEKRSLRKNSVMSVHHNENIKPAYLEEANKVFNDLPNEIREDICAMSFSMFKNKLKNYLFDKTIAKILSCSSLDRQDNDS